MKLEHYAQLRELILPEHSIELYSRYLNLELSNMRYRWDLIQRAKILNRNEISALFDGMYMYLNDDHIDTALRKILNYRE